MQNQYSISVVICAFTFERWLELVAAVNSVLEQLENVHDLIVVSDHNPALLERIKAELPMVIAVDNTGPQGASSARNSGAAYATGSIIAFLDDDAIAYSDWITNLRKGFMNANAIGVGGYIEPMWSKVRPRWFPEEFLWVVGGSYKGMPTTPTVVRNTWSGNMAVRTDVFSAIQGFRIGFGKVGSRSNPEDTDFCIRALKQIPDGVWFYLPDAKVRHRIPPERSSFKFFLHRCYNEGVGKSQLAKLVGADSGTSSERGYMVKVLPIGVITNLIGVLTKGDLGGIARSASIVLGLTCTVLGYIIGFIFVGAQNTNHDEPPHNDKTPLDGI